MTDDGGQWVTVAQAAQALGVSQRTVRRWAEVGKLPIRRDVRPHVVNIAGQRPDTSDAVAGQVGDLEAEIARLRERVQELVQERDYLRALAGSLAQGQRLMLEARPRRRWRWPWHRGE